MGSALSFGRAAVAAAEVIATKPNRHQLTQEQRSVVAGWPGWGPLAPVFESSPTASWAALGEQLEGLLGAEQVEQGAHQCDNAFFTSGDVAERVWGLLTGAGFCGGRVLDLGCGSGVFASACPAGVDIDYYGVEIDPTSAQVAQLLHPHSRITCEKLQEVTLPTAGFDLVVGNVPFGRGWVHSRHGAAPSLHDYFLQRAVAAVRPGGLVAVITSRYQMDSQSGLSSVIDQARLVGAVRLPSKVFAAEGTDVVADLVVLQVRDPFDDGDRSGEYEHGQNQVSEPVRAGSGAGYPAAVARYFTDRPELVAGKMRSTGHFRNNLAVVTRKPTQMLDRAFSALSALMPTYVPRGADDTAWADSEIVADRQGRAEGSFHYVDDAIYQVVDGVLSPLSGKAAGEVSALVRLRDAALELIRAESDLHTADSVLDPLRCKARDLYRDYVAEFGPVNRVTIVDGPADPDTGVPSQRVRRPRLGGFRADPQAEVVFGLERFDEASGQAEPAEILMHRTNRRPEQVLRVQSPAEAVTVSLSRHGRLHVPTIAALLDVPHEQVDTVLGDVAFRDPVSGELLASSEYLSGNIADKLDRARDAAQVDSSFARHVAALTKVMPPRLGPDEISVAFGASWLEPDDIRKFLTDSMGYASAQVSYSPAVALWEVQTFGLPDASLEATYGTSRMSVVEIVTAGLNGGTPVVYDHFDDPDTGKERKVRNAAQSALASERLVTLTERFTVWLWSDPDRAARVVDTYNRRFNSVVPRVADGRYLQFPSMVPGRAMWDNQLAGIDHVLRGRHQAALLAHSMGAGKTLTMIGLCLKLREYGLANRPLITVPKAVLEQFGREARTCFPTGAFLVATDDQVAGRAKRRFVARAASGDWDAVIVSHEMFTSLSADPKVEMAYLAEELAALNTDDGGSRGAKATAARRRAMENKIDALRESRHDPDTLTFSMLGVDHLVVDEAHRFKGLPVATRTSGLSNSTSQRALDLLVKITSLSAANPGRPVATLGTGTPWVNSLSESFVWNRMCAPDLLEAAGCRAFDQWAATFVRWETVIETSPDGGSLRANTRPVRIRNAPELRTMMRAFTDMVPSSELPIERPDVQRELLTAQPNAAQIQHMATLSERLESLRRDGFKTEKGADNILNICGDGRALALDPQLLGIRADSPKLTLAADAIAEHYREHADYRYPGSDTPGTFQLVCLDLGTPGTDGDWRSYGRLRSLLADRGVPAGRVRFIHQARTGKDRDELFAACRDGRVSVLIGSSSRAGIGVNVQPRLSQVVHVDHPWTPSDRSQREGRAVRPGNLNSQVRIVDVVTEGTFDGLVTAAVSRKQLMIEQLFTTAPLDREIVDVSGDAISLAEVTAAATGHPELIEQAEVAAQVQRLKVARSSHSAQVRKMSANADAFDREADRATRMADWLATLDSRVTHRQRSLTRGQATDAAEVLRPRNSGRRYHYGRLYLQRLDSSATVEIRWRGATVGHCDLPRPVPRSVSGLAEALYTRVDDWSRSLPNTATRLQEQAANHRAEATNLRELANSLPFAQERELVTAQARLDELTARIAVMAEETAGNQSAA